MTPMLRVSTCPLPVTTFCLALVLLFAAPFEAQAQAAQQITFDQAVQLALDQNVTLRRAENTLELQGNVVMSERADFLPNLNMSASAARGWGLNFNQTTGELDTQSSDGFNINASTNLPLFSGFNNLATLKRAKYNLDAADYSYDRTRQTVLFNVISNYLQVILSKEQIAITEENLTAQRQQLSQIEEFVNVGTRSVSDLYQQQAAVANSELQLIEAERQAALNETRLIQVLQLDPFGEYDFVTPDMSSLTQVPRSYNVEEMLQSAFSQRADLRAQEAAIAASRQNIRSAKSGYYPTFSIGASMSSDFTSLNNNSFGTQLNDNRFRRFGFNMQVPLFNRLQTKTGVEQAKVQYEGARLDLENLQQNIALEVRQAYLDYQTASKRLQASEAQFQAAEQALEVEQERYGVGASTLVELQQARATFVQASSNRASAVFQFHFQHRLIEYYLGVLNPAEPLFSGN